MTSIHTTILISNFRNMFHAIDSSTSYNQRHIARKNIMYSTLFLNGLCETIRNELVNYNE